MLIEQIQVKGYKSLVDATLHVRPLTLLAGTNSSGKSSIMQPLLLIKQTMEASYQPAGALVLSGAHVQAETADELISKLGKAKKKEFSVDVTGINSGSKKSSGCGLTYQLNGNEFNVKRQKTFGGNSQQMILEPGLNAIEIQQRFKEAIPNLSKSLDSAVSPNNGFLDVVMLINFTYGEVESQRAQFAFSLQTALSSLLHISGLRPQPGRNYPATFFQNQIKGTFDLYAAGTISQWQQQNNAEALTKLNDYLIRLGLTNSITAKVKNANEVELSVNRLPATSKTKPRKTDMVNIADVGIGVSQVLPILVALIAAQEGQIVYIEQPELHLHPRAQVVMAELVADSAKRGVRVIVETHSSLLLLTVQTLVAEGTLKPEEVALHWFARDAKGATTVTLAEVDENGAYGDWPEDFGDVELAAQSAYLNTNTNRQPFTPLHNEG